jgi:hypothetical protein
MRTGLSRCFGKKDTVQEYIDVVINWRFLIFLSLHPVMVPEIEVSPHEHN